MPCPKTPCDTPTDPALTAAEPLAPACLSRREVRRQSRRDTILDVATHSFMELGYAGTTMSAIAAALGGSKGTLWGYFPSKELLFAAVLDRATSSFREQLSQTLNPDDDIDVALQRFCTRFLDRLTSPEGLALFRLVIGETGRFAEVGQMFYVRGPQVTQGLLADFLDAAMSLGRLRQADPREAAQLLMQMCMAGGHYRLLMGMDAKVSPATKARDVALALEVFGRAYGV